MKLMAFVDRVIEASVEDADELRRMNLFISKIEVLPSGCWRLRGKRSNNGYARCRFRARPGEAIFTSSAHRFAYKIFVGPLKKEMEIHHECKKRWCVCPRHLKQVTDLEHYAIEGEAMRIGLRRYKQSITHCPQGHDYKIHGRLVVRTNGSTQRACKICVRDAQRKSRCSKLFINPLSSSK